MVYILSYLLNTVCFCGRHKLFPLPLKYDVPQRSVFGLILFTLYSQPVSDKIREHNISY